MCQVLGDVEIKIARFEDHRIWLLLNSVPSFAVETLEQSSGVAFVQANREALQELGFGAGVIDVRLGCRADGDVAEDWKRCVAPFPEHRNHHRDESKP